MKNGDLLPRFAARLGKSAPAGPAVVAVSGGADSVTLLDLLVRSGFRGLHVAHFDHGLRGARGADDARFSEGLAEELGLPFLRGRGDTRARARKNHESIEEAARALRRAFLARAARRTGSKTVFLGHHANDVAETVLFHLCRGTGARGVGSLRFSSPLGNSGATIVRPLLGFSRAEIGRYAQERGLRWRTDETNASREHTRNRMRLDALPVLAAAAGVDPVPALARAAEIFAAEDDWLEALVAEDARAETLDVRALRQMPPARQRRLLRAWLRRGAGLEIDFESAERALGLADPRATAAKLNLPRGHHLRRKAGKLFVQRPPK